jgi:hypothetical protein
MRVMDDPLHGLARCVQVSRCVGEPAQASIGGEGDSGQRLVDRMCHGGRHLAKRHDAGGVHEVCLRPLPFFLGLRVFSQIYGRTNALDDITGVVDDRVAYTVRTTRRDETL